MRNTIKGNSLNIISALEALVNVRFQSAHRKGFFTQYKYQWSALLIIKSFFVCYVTRAQN
jgi:hypothetical protein